MWFCLLPTLPQACLKGIKIDVSSRLEQWNPVPLPIPRFTCKEKIVMQKPIIGSALKSLRFLHEDPFMELGMQVGRGRTGNGIPIPIPGSHGAGIPHLQIPNGEKFAPLTPP